MDPCFPQAAEISVSPGMLLVLALQPPNQESTMQAPWNVGLCSQSRSPELGIQQSQASTLSPLCFSSSHQWAKVGEGLGSCWAMALVHYPVPWGLFFTPGVCSFWRSPLSCCSFKISCINYIFILHAVLGGSLCLTSHAANFNPFLSWLVS